MSHLRFHAPSPHIASPFGRDRFGRLAESFARAFGSPYFLVAQTVIVIVWVALNVAHITTFDLYPFILLNLAFSFQAAYAAPLILLAETREADRDHATPMPMPATARRSRASPSTSCSATPTSPNASPSSPSASTPSPPSSTTASCRPTRPRPRASPVVLSRPSGLASTSVVPPRIEALPSPSTDPSHPPAESSR